MWRPKARQHQKTPSRLTSMWKRQCSSLVSSARTSLFADAGVVDQDVDARRDRARPSSATASTSDDLVTSSVAACASRPSARARRVACLRAVGHQSAMTTSGAGLAERLGAGDSRCPARRRSRRRRDRSARTSRDTSRCPLQACGVRGLIAMSASGWRCARWTARRRPRTGGRLGVDPDRRPVVHAGGVLAVGARPSSGSPPIAI